MFVLGIIIGLIIGFFITRDICKFCIASYLVTTGRTKRASIDIARVILNGKYVKFNKQKMKNTIND